MFGVLFLLSYTLWLILILFITRRAWYDISCMSSWTIFSPFTYIIPLSNGHIQQCALLSLHISHLFPIFMHSRADYMFYSVLWFYVAFLRTFAFLTRNAFIATYFFSFFVESLCDKVSESLSTKNIPCLHQKPFELRPIPYPSLVVQSPPTYTD